MPGCPNGEKWHMNRILRDLQVFLLGVVVAITAGVCPARIAKAADCPFGVLVRPGDRIAVLGDSISGSNGYGFKAVQIMNKAQPDLKLTYLYHGHPGARADQAEKSLSKLLADKPTLVTIMFGTNDLGQQGAVGISEIRGRLRKLVVPIRASGSRVVLLTTPYNAADNRAGAERNKAGLPRMAEEVFALGQELHVPVLDMFTVMRLADEEGKRRDPSFFMFSSPGNVHPSQAGHQIMGEALAEFLLGKKVPPRVPFKWKYTGEPRASAAKVAVPIDVASPATAWPPAAAAMMIDNQAQVSDPKAWKGPADLSARAVAAWDEANLYLSVTVTDDIALVGATQNTWGEDGVEFFLDTRPPDQRDVAYSPGFYQFFVGLTAADGPAKVLVGRMGPADTAQLKAYCRRTSKGYAISVAVPWQALNWRPSAGGNLGFDYLVNDRDDSAPKARHYWAMWRGAGHDFNNAGSTGMLELHP